MPHPEMDYRRSRAENPGLDVEVGFLGEVLTQLGYGGDTLGVLFSFLGGLGHLYICDHDLAGFPFPHEHKELSDFLVAVHLRYAEIKSSRSPSRTPSASDVSHSVR